MCFWRLAKNNASEKSANQPYSSGEAATPAAEAAPAAAAMEAVPGTFSKICALEDLPRGDRKKVTALGKSILLFWYKDTVFCIESRSPAEGAFSEGFTKARLTQDGCIVCPTTMSTFELRTVGAVEQAESS
jgi:nitrite reductase/ring-hydroxylating ferredoxin subunit